MYKDKLLARVSERIAFADNVQIDIKERLSSLIEAQAALKLATDLLIQEFGAQQQRVVPVGYSGNGRA